MRQAKVDQLRHEIQVLSQAHEREVDRWVKRGVYCCLLMQRHQQRHQHT